MPVNNKIREVFAPTSDDYSQMSSYQVRIEDTGEFYNGDNLTEVLTEIGTDLVDLDDRVVIVEDTTEEHTATLEQISVPRWDDLQVELTPTRINPATSKPDFDYTRLGFLFPQNDLTEIVFFTMQMPHTYQEGTDVFPHVHIHQQAIQQVAMRVEYKWYNIGDPIPTEWSVYNMTAYAREYTSGTIAQVVKNVLPISGAGKKISSFLKIKLYRTDNVYVGDVLVDQFDIHYQRDSFGSGEEFVK